MRNRIETILIGAMALGINFGTMDKASAVDYVKMSTTGKSNAVEGGMVKANVVLDGTFTTNSLVGSDWRVRIPTNIVSFSSASLPSPDSNDFFYGFPMDPSLNKVGTNLTGNVLNLSSRYTFFLSIGPSNRVGYLEDIFLPSKSVSTVSTGVIDLANILVVGKDNSVQYKFLNGNLVTNYQKLVVHPSRDRLYFSSIMTDSIGITKTGETFSVAYSAIGKKGLDETDYVRERTNAPTWRVAAVGAESLNGSNVALGEYSTSANTNIGGAGGTVDDEGVVRADLVLERDDDSGGLLITNAALVFESLRGMAGLSTNHAHLARTFIGGAYAVSNGGDFIRYDDVRELMTNHAGRIELPQFLSFTNGSGTNVAFGFVEFQRRAIAPNRTNTRALRFRRGGGNTNVMTVCAVPGSRVADVFWSSTNLVDWTNEGTNEAYVGVDAANFYASGGSNLGGLGSYEINVDFGPGTAREFYKIERVGARPYGP